MAIAVEISPVLQRVASKLAAEQGLSVEDLLKRCVEDALLPYAGDALAMGHDWPEHSELGPGLTGEARTEARRRARAAAGALTGGPRDIARNHDKYIAEAFKP